MAKLHTSARFLLVRVERGDPLEALRDVTRSPDSSPLFMWVMLWGAEALDVETESDRGTTVGTGVCCLLKPVEEATTTLSVLSIVL